PLPPSLNRYYRHIGAKTLISEDGRAYRELVCRTLERDYPMLGKIKMNVTAHMPDRRRRDLDNLLKALQDSMAHANV
ncbi:RusA family crossover junction endodeoxyribonuclease, partial [Streptococcus pseudopneumoniae]|uniref:RusA family crossover junction endodeoxyribonuclease n=1 Tax=Streptococcus pseudopneumoniae TaxID=257758 RepID=UPI0018B01B2A|nr:RusA family crossover junction endodeoxyribonuclease [Streptococcus pseudopneumoniae]